MQKQAMMYHCCRRKRHFVQEYLLHTAVARDYRRVSRLLEWENNPRAWTIDMQDRGFVHCLGYLRVPRLQAGSE